MMKDIAPIQSQLNLSVMALVALVAIVGIVALMLNAPALRSGLDQPALERVYVEQPNEVGEMNRVLFRSFASAKEGESCQDESECECPPLYVKGCQGNKCVCEG